MAAAKTAPVLMRGRCAAESPCQEALSLAQALAADPELTQRPVWQGYREWGRGCEARRCKKSQVQ